MFTRMYVDTCRHMPITRQSMLHTVSGYRINDIFATFCDNRRNSARYGLWELIHIPTNTSVATLQTRKDAYIAAYAFLPHDLQHASIDEDHCTIWSDQDSKENARQTWLTLKHESDLSVTW